MRRRVLFYLNSARYPLSLLICDQIQSVLETSNHSDYTQNYRLATLILSSIESIYFNNTTEMMISAHKNRSEHLIYQRRAQQEKLDALTGKLKQEFYHKQFAKWENRGADVEKITEIRRRLQQLRQNARRDLNMRRQRLAALLENEHHKFQKEIIDSQETPQQVRARMAERVRQLKEERENEKKKFVDEQLQRRFEMNADELRKVDAELKELRTDLDRNVQLMEKQSLMQNKYEEQMLFAELNRRQLKKREEVQKQKEKESREKVEQRNAILGLQRQMKQEKAKKDKELTEMEKQMLRQEWERQRQAQKQRETEAFLRQKDATRQLLEANQLQRKMKELQARRQKQADKDLLEQVLSRERQQAEAEKEQRLKEKEEAKRFLAGFKTKNAEIQAQQKELQRMIEQERQKREVKEYEQWLKTQEARIKLLKDVYHDRDRKVKDNINQRQEERRLKELEKQKIEQSLNQYNQEQQQRKNQELIRNKQQQERLLEQIRLKEQKRRLLLLELQREESDINRARKDYDKKIQQRKQKGRQELQQFKKTNRIF